MGTLLVRGSLIRIGLRVGIFRRAGAGVWVLKGNEEGRGALYKCIIGDAFSCIISGSLL